MRFGCLARENSEKGKAAAAAAGCDGRALPTYLDLVDTRILDARGPRYGQVGERFDL